MKIKKGMRGLVGFLVIMLLVVTNFVPVQAATKTILKTNVKNESIDLIVGKSQKVKVTSNKKFTYEITDKRIVSASRKGNILTVKGKSYGACGIFVKAGDKKILLNVSVKNKTTNTQTKKDPDRLTDERCYKVVEIVNQETKDAGHVYLPDNKDVRYGGQGLSNGTNKKTTLQMDKGYSETELYNFVAFNGGHDYFYLYFAGVKDGKATFYTYNYREPTQLSFNDTTFRTGETCGTLSVLNRVPGSKYNWETDNPNVVGITVLKDNARVKILANSEGSANVSCTVTYPMGEQITLSSKVNVSDVSGSSLVDMNQIMSELPIDLAEKGYDFLPNYLTAEEISWYGLDAGCSGSNCHVINSTKQYQENWMADLQILGRTNEEIKEDILRLCNKAQLYVEYNGIKDNGYYVFGQYGNDYWKSGVVPYHSEW